MTELVENYIFQQALKAFGRVAKGADLAKAKSGRGGKITEVA